jgi:hypothetical protein
MYSKLVEQTPDKYPANMGKAWLDDEVVRLLKSVKAKKTHSEIALEHGRTLGGIVSKLKGIAADYYFGDQRSLDDIQRFTGLDKETISDAISKREWQNSVKEEKAKARGPTTKTPLVNVSVKDKKIKVPKESNEPIMNTPLVKAGEPTIAEVYELLKDIQKDFKIIVEKIETMAL